MKPRIVSFHTPDQIYSHTSNKFRSSLERLELPHSIVERKPIGRWARNNHIKPRVIQQFHEDGARPVLWIDCDSIVWRDPQPIIDQLGGADFASAWHPHATGEHLFASTLYFGPSCRARDLLRDWITRCEAAGERGAAFDWKQSDQMHLQEALAAAKEHGLRAARLPPSMAFVHDTDRKRHGCTVKPIIEAFNVSWLGRSAERPGCRQIARVIDLSTKPIGLPDRLVVSFHTPDDLYSHEANGLRSSLEQIGVPHWIPQRQAIGQWSRNNHLKPEVIRQAHAGGTRAVLWTDADSLVWADPWPAIEALGPCDVAVCWHQFRSGRAVFASTVYFAPTRAAAQVLDDWIVRCHGHANDAANRPLDHHASDQPHLQRAIEAAVARRQLSVVELPPTLAFVHDTDRRRHPGIRARDIIVEAFQASRLSKNPERYLARTTGADRAEPAMVTA